MKKTILKIGIIIFILIIYIYACNISMFPSNIILFEGQELELKTILGINIKSKSNYETLQASTNLNQAIKEKIGKIDFSVNLFENIPVKEVSVNIIPKTKVIPIGSTIGLKLYTQGILVVGMSEIQGEQPYQNSGIKEGDTILSINNKKIGSTTELIEIINTMNGQDVNIEYLSNGEKKHTTISPSKYNKNEYKLGLWVSDAAAGVGTITYYEPKTKQFAALGHGIQDIDTGSLITISKGQIVTASIVDIKKGERGNPRRNKRKYFDRTRNRGDI